MEPSKSQSIPPTRTSNRGVALVLVLCLLVLISGIVIAFFSSVSNEYASAKSASAGSTGKELADATVQLVMSQIRQATSKGPNIAWASQPGMIRTWGEGDNASYKKLGYYKLYSSENMVLTGAAIENFNLDNEVPSADVWKLRKSQYVDLNQPVTDELMVQHYPIINPSAADNPPGKSSPMIEGFSIDATAAPLVGSPNKAAMPVKWIYVLRDGTLSLPDDARSTESTAGFVTGRNTTPTITNPIVGRIAFWTDDETCKINVNTAVGGSPWDQPMFDSGIESAFSRYQPAAHEYGRYPGHPAGTSLSPVFWSFSSMPSPDHSLASNPSFPTSGYNIGFCLWGDWAPVLPDYAKDYWQKALKTSPRNELGDVSSGTPPILGGSRMGTMATAGCNLPGSTTGVGLPCPVDTDRLYSSVDELMFFLSGAEKQRVGRSEENSYEFKLSKTDVEKTRFFLTASSRAPEVNLFNQPKVAIWPVPDLGKKSVANTSSISGDTRSPSDKLIAFCSTLNNKEYYFARYDALSPTNDFSNDSARRNSVIYNYLNRLLAKPVPGFGDTSITFASRYGAAGSSQILTEIYDYIRSCVNLQDSSAGKDNDLLLTRVKWSYTTAPVPRTNPPVNLTIGSSQPGTGQVVPFLHPDNGTKGLGRFPTIKQMSIMFIARGANQPPLQVLTSGTGVGRPIIYDVNDTGIPLTPLVDENTGNLKTSGLVPVLSYSVTAKSNDLHPYSADAVVSQLVKEVNKIKYPVLAVDDVALKAALITRNDSEIASAIYPVFSVNNSYPTICRVSGTDKVINVGGVGDIQEITLNNGTKYSYFKAGRVDASGIAIPDAISGDYPPQTHAGLNYLTIPRLSGSSIVTQMQGAYDVDNPRYQIAANGQHRLQPYETAVEAIFFVDPVNNAPGFMSLSTDYRVRIRGLDSFQVNGQKMEFSPDATETAKLSTGNAIVGGGSLYEIGALTHVGLRADNTPANRPEKMLNFYSRPKVIQAGTSQGAEFNFIGADGASGLTVDLLPAASTGNNNPVQTYNIKFPGGTFPTPKLPFIPVFASAARNAPSLTGAGNDLAYSLLYYDNPATPSNVSYPPTKVVDLTPSSTLTFTKLATSGTNLLSSNPNFGVGCSLSGTTGSLYCNDRTRLYSGSYQGAGMELILPERDVAPSALGDYKYKLTADTVRSIECAYGDTRVIAALKTVPSDFFVKHKFYDKLPDGTFMRSAHSIFGAAKSGINADAGKGTLSALRGATCSYLTDVTININNPKTSYVGKNSSTGGAGTPTWGYPTNAPDRVRALLGASTGLYTPLFTNGFPHVASTVNFEDAIFRAIWSRTGDFDNGPNFNPDGPYINKAPETTAREDVNKQTWVPDFNCNIDANSVGDSLFSPNRQISSAVMFGSLPAGFHPSFSASNPSINDIDPWRTLLFCPNPNSQNHPALSQHTPAGKAPVVNTAPDFMLLDLFQMPVVEPYAISEPFSTAGKVNMNYQIAPFTFIKRDTAMRGVLRSILLTAVDDKFIGFYKGSNFWYFFNDGGPLDDERKARGHWDFRYPVHPAETLKQFDARFQDGDIFHSAAEICSLWLYPAKQPTASSPGNPQTALVSYDDNSSKIRDWWYAGSGDTRKSLTGDNMRERPYSALYPRLTTKSNSYTVHFRVQVLKKAKSTDAAQWVEDKDRVMSEYRGSSLIERYIDPNDSNLPDFALPGTVDTLDNYYKFRVVNTKKFTAE